MWHFFAFFCPPFVVIVAAAVGTFAIVTLVITADVTLFLHHFTYLLSMIIIYQRSLWRLNILLCAKREAKGLRSKCIVRYAPLPFSLLYAFYLSFYLVLSHSVTYLWSNVDDDDVCVYMLKSSVSIYVTSVDMSLSLSSFILLFLWLFFESVDQP